MHKNEITKTHPKRQIKVLNGHVSYCVSQQDDSQEGKCSAKTHITDAVQVPGNLTQPVEFHRHLNTTLTV